MTRPADALRPVTMTPDFVAAPLASLLVATGGTRVLCTASLEEWPTTTCSSARTPV